MELRQKFKKIITFKNFKGVLYVTHLTCDLKIDGYNKKYTPLFKGYNMKFIYL